MQCAHMDVCAYRGSLLRLARVSASTSTACRFAVGHGLTYSLLTPRALRPQASGRLSTLTPLRRGDRGGHAPRSTERYTQFSVHKSYRNHIYIYIYIVYTHSHVHGLYRRTLQCHRISPLVYSSSCVSQRPPTPWQTRFSCGFHLVGRKRRDGFGHGFGGLRRLVAGG